MTIYILDQDPKMTAQYLDDKSLDNMIRTIAQVLVDAHYYNGAALLNDDGNLPLKSPSFRYDIIKWSQWARESIHNYEFLCSLSKECCKENLYRTGKEHKTNKIIIWANKNKPRV